MADGQFENIEACVFDVYGTLLDFNSAVTRCRDEIGDKADQLSDLWRRKQLEYTWLRSLMGDHADFWQVTGEALDHSLAALSIETPSLRERLMSLYRGLDPYEEVSETLQTIKSAGIKTAVLSNGEPAMLEEGLAAAGIRDLLDEIYSIESVGIFKPHPSVYDLATKSLDVSPEQIAFQSANGWDIAGAASYGFSTVWVNRSGLAEEQLPAGPAATIPSLTTLPQLIGI
ncbi:MAG: haloacid dehalogenase type II [Rhodospirillaceae bacterium]|nr:haloacid dehalogenase type II [Rhodospirillaceae bacterium]|tara:strand:+ start:9352 stop:10038 length:687 start_codon:yes stop_codon:yes gene_type:complete